MEGHLKNNHQHLVSTEKMEVICIVSTDLGKHESNGDQEQEKLRRRLGKRIYRI